MANANIALLTTSNTFIQWLTSDNNLINSVNNLRNSNYVKDNGSFILPNGSLQVTSTSGTGLSISNNVLFSQLATMNTVVITGAASVGANLTVTGNFIIQGATLYSTDTLVLRNGLSTAGNGQLIIQQGTGNGNVELQYYISQNVFRMTSNANTPVTNGWQTLLTNTNIADTWSSTSANNLTSANIANGLYALVTSAYAVANTSRIYANGTAIVVGNISNVNFNNTATINVSAIANGIQSNISFSVNSSAIPSATQLANAYNQANAGYAAANAGYAAANAGYAAANAGYAAANTAYNVAVFAYNEANSAYSLGSSATIIAENAYAEANAAYSIIVSSSPVLYTAYAQANLATSIAESAYGTANTAQATGSAATTIAENAYTEANAAYVTSTGVGVVITNGNGKYSVMPGGLIIAWGIKTLSSGGVTVNFPCTFNVTPSISLTADGYPGGSPSTYVNSPGTASFVGYGGPVNYFWQAMGI